MAVNERVGGSSTLGSEVTGKRAIVEGPVSFESVEGPADGEAK